MEDAKLFLEKLCAYVSSFEFSKNVIAVQVAAMQTEEWLALRTESGCFDKAPQYRCDMTKAYPDGCRQIAGEIQRM